MEESTQYVIKEIDINKRREFYDYIINKYNYKTQSHSKEEMINSEYPFIVDHNKKEFWVCESIACLSVVQSAGLIVTIDEFKKISK